MTASDQAYRLLVFGGTGAIGQAIVTLARARGWEATVVSRHPVADGICWNPLAGAHLAPIDDLKARGIFDAVCWAQGENFNDSVYDFDVVQHERMYQSNVVYILNSLHALLTHASLRRPTRFVVISSIWQNLARQQKLSYSITKAALHGLVLSAANDLGRDGHLFNAVLPGVLDTPMTHRNLTQEQIAKISAATQLGRLPCLADVAETTCHLLSPQNTGLTGQFIKVDLGFSDVRII
jgi:3-oxoacyl-[acyl-carrier protein] reductase